MTKQDTDTIADRLDRPMAALGLIFLFVVVAQAFTQPGTQLALAFEVATWLLWAVFVTEFLVRLYVAPSARTFLRRNWWQAVLLLVPFLRFLRVVRAARMARAGRIVSSAVRGGRSARHQLAGRLGWLATATVITILAGSQLLFELGSYATYAAALHETTLAVVSGEPLTADGAVADVAEVLLALYSVVVFATIAGTVGAFFIDHGAEDAAIARRNRAVAID